MYSFDSIGRMAGVLGITPSSLRYWEKEGLLTIDRDPQNGYRRISMPNLLDILDIAMYRNLSVPIGDLKTVLTAETGALARMLTDSEAAVAAQMAALENTRAQLRQKQALIDRLDELSATTPRIVETRLATVVPLEMVKGGNVSVYLQDRSKAAALLTPDRYDKEPVYGLFHDGDHPLRPADAAPRRYCHALLRIDTYARTTDAPALAMHTQAQGYRTGSLVGRYLITAVEGGIRTAFYEAWIELL